jgi:hypothetical protein
MRGLPVKGLFDRVWYVAAPPERLAVLRLLIGGCALFYLLVRSGHLVGAAFLPARQFHPVGPVVLLDAPLPGFVAAALVVACIATAVAFVAGWRFRVTGPLFAALLLWVTSYRNSWGMVFHTENLMVLHVMVLGLAPSADALSADRRRQRGDAHGRYGWAIQLMCALTVATYFLAGMAKLEHAGFDWVTSDTLRNYVAYDNVRKAELGASHSFIGAFAVRYDALFPPIAAASLGLELGAPLALLHRRVAAWWAAGAWGFHVGVLVIMAIVFHYPLLGFAYLPFFRVERGLDGLRRFRAGRWALRWAPEAPQATQAMP